MAKTSDAQLRAVRNYKAKNPIHKAVVEFGKHDEELWDYYRAQPRKSEYIRELIRADMEAHKDALPAFPAVVCAMKEKGWEKSDLIREAHIGPETAVAVLGTNRAAALDTLGMLEAQRIAKALGLTVDELMTKQEAL